MYVIYDRETTKIVRVFLKSKRCWQDAIYKTEATAERMLEKLGKEGKLDKLRWSYDIADLKKFASEIEKKEVRHGIGPCEGKKYEVSVNTPWTSGPWSETYWSS